MLVTFALSQKFSSGDYTPGRGKIVPRNVNNYTPGRGKIVPRNVI